MLEETLESENEKQILREFLFENRELEQLEEVVDEFNVFTALKIVKVELRHSTFLCWLMNPNETHGLGDYFLKSFLKLATFKASTLKVEAPSIFEIDGWDLDQAEVIAEWRNIDILVRDDNHKFVCIIENKVYSTEHTDQLNRYKVTVQRELPDFKKLFIYLTIEGEPAKGNSEYLHTSYSEISDLVKQLVETKKSKLSTEIVSFITQYDSMLRRYIVRDSRVEELCKIIYQRHKKALDLIFEHISDKVSEVSDSIANIIQSDPDLILDTQSKSAIRFIPKKMDFIPHTGEGWTKSKRILLFEINNTPEKIESNLYIGPGPSEIRTKLYGIAHANTSLFTGAVRILRPQWLQIHKHQLLKGKEISELSVDEITNLFTDRFRKYKESDLVSIEKELKQFLIP